MSFNVLGVAESTLAGAAFKLLVGRNAVGGVVTAATLGVSESSSSIMSGMSSASGPLVTGWFTTLGVPTSGAAVLFAGLPRTLNFTPFAVAETKRRLSTRLSIF